MIRCSQCIMPESVPGIHFDKNGICNFCQDYKIETYHGEDELKNIICSAKKKSNSKYDCVVPLSGGRESTYLLYLSKILYNLNVLAVSYDNEFRVDQAIINMKRACKTLNIDFISLRSKRDIAHKIVKYNILSSLKYGQNGLCSACTYGIRSTVYKAAEDHKIPLIFWGHTQHEATHDEENKAFEALKINRSKLFKLLNKNFYKSEYFAFLQRLEFPVKKNRILSRTRPFLRNKNIKEIHIFDYIPFDRKVIKETIHRELGWQKPKSHISTWRTDCKLHSFVNYYFYNLFGCTKDCFGYCKMINNGQMIREEALKNELQTIANISKNINELLEKNIGISKRIMNKKNFF